MKPSSIPVGPPEVGAGLGNHLGDLVVVEVLGAARPEGLKRCEAAAPTEEPLTPWRLELQPARIERQRGDRGQVGVAERDDRQAPRKHASPPRDGATDALGDRFRYGTERFPVASGDTPLRSPGGGSTHNPSLKPRFRRQPM